MIVCHCHRVSDAAVRRVVEHGAESLDEVADRCAAGSRCGGCSLRILQILQAATSTSARRELARAS